MKKILVIDDGMPSAQAIVQPEPEKNENTPKTYLQQLFEGMTILTKRPDSMPYEDYRIIRKQQSNALKALIKVK